MCSCPKIDRLPYRLPELLAADPGATVYVGEGEKDTNRLWDEGLVATCNSGGAKKWEAHLSDYLVGRDVVIPPDNDNDGEAHGQLVARLLQGKARSVKVLDLPGLGAKGDVSDWLDQGGTIDKLVRLAGDCEKWEPEDSNSVYGWENPQSFESVEVPAFPVDALPPNVAEYVRQEAEAKQVPVDLPGCLCLGAIATAVAGKVKVFLTGEWAEPLNNFFVVVLSS